MNTADIEEERQRAEGPGKWRVTNDAEQGRFPVEWVHSAVE